MGVQAVVETVLLYEAPPQRLDVARSELGLRGNVQHGLMQLIWAHTGPQPGPGLLQIKAYGTGKLQSASREVLGDNDRGHAMEKQRLRELVLRRCQLRAREVCAIQQNARIVVVGIDVRAL